jgi:predicted TIM-barrel fold metal-dependent hydrolase
VNVADLVAIDVHTHAKRNTGAWPDPVTEEVLAAVIFTVDDEAGMGRRRLGNDEVLAAAAANPDVLIPFASVDPHKGKLGVREAREWIERGARGFKFPNTQAFWPNDTIADPLYEVIAEAGLIALFHSGTPLAGGLREARHPRGGAPARAQGERGAPAGPQRLT